MSPEAISLPWLCTSTTSTRLAAQVCRSSAPPGRWQSKNSAPSCGRPSSSLLLVAADRLAGARVDVTESVPPAAHQPRVPRRGLDIEPPADLHRPQPVPP